MALIEAQEAIRLAVRRSIFERESHRDEIDEIIKSALAFVLIPSLRKAAEKSLRTFSRAEQNTARMISARDAEVFTAGVRLFSGDLNDFPTDVRRSVKKMTAAKAEKIISQEYGDVEGLASISGGTLGKFPEEYYRRHILPTISRMEKEEALDPDAETYLGQRQSLRSRAEREVRYQAHIDEMQGLRGRGVKLVIISTHANCSARCAPFQGRVFSLDKTRGVTPDGRAYEPIETATDIYTPNGKWKNGLFGFNCRHYAVPYEDGKSFPMPSAREEKKEYAIDMRMRQLERNVRKWRVRAGMAVLPQEARMARSKARQWHKAYRLFSEQNGRGYQASRLKI